MMMNELGFENEPLLRLCRVDPRTELPARLYAPTPESVAAARIILTRTLLNGGDSHDESAVLHEPVYKDPQSELSRLRRTAAVLANLGLLRHVVKGSADWPESKVHSQRLLEETAMLPAIDIDDLWQEGLIALHEAAGQWRYGAGSNFGSYAIRWIKQAIPRAVTRGGRTVEVSLNTLRLYRTNEAGDISGLPLESDISDEPKWPDWIAAVPMTYKPDLADPDEQAVYSQSCLTDNDLPVVPDVPLRSIAVDGGYDDVIEELDKPYIQTKQRHYIAMLMEPLDKRGRFIIDCAFGLTDGRPKSIEYISKKIRLSVDYTSKLKNLALRTMRQRAIG
jgi:DNA-directed RNA polymerase specialized sigma subunit